MKKAKISKHALIQRINRRLAKDGEVLKAGLGEKVISDLGNYFIVDTSHNAIVSHDVEIEELGRKIKVLKPYETVDMEGRS